MRVALLQMAPTGDPSTNAVKGEEFCRSARGMGADIALFPEMWNVGYAMPDPGDDRAVEEWSGQAIGRADDFVARFESLARELQMAIALTFLRESPSGPKNTVTLFDRHGRVALEYSKVHTCDFDREALLARGDGFEVTALDTAIGDVSVGAMICYDREFPESARLLMLKGAEVVLTPNACDLELNRISQFRTRAFENMMAMVMTNYPQPACNGHSIAFDGIAFAEDESGRDMLLVESDETEGVWLASIDLEALRRYRSRETWGDAFRRPSLYGALTQDKVRDPFRRESARR